ncbi:MAG: FtsW/RodA/SpoVE family cell cycle protein [Eubacteriales bacterium]|nr:FtsW/RodA/SpoVE family cell cycle protein [Eubacteriales bacterium]NLV69652.1 rod shape-determining protein RodA [Clostridiales bacterium]
MLNIKNLLKNMDLSLLLWPAVLVLISIVMIGSTAYEDGFVFDQSMMKQMLAFGLGILVLIFILLFDYRCLPGFEKLIYPLTILFLLSVYSPLGSTQFGTRGWLDLGRINLQPSELGKVLFIVLFAAYLNRTRQDLQHLTGVLKALLYATPPIFVVILQNDLGNALVYCVVAGIMLVIAGAEYKSLGIITLATAVSSPLIYFLLRPHQQQRILAFFHPNDATLAVNYQVWQSKMAIGSGGLTGKGLFLGTQKGLDWLPVQESDFLFAVIGEELGFLGGGILLLIFGIFLYRMLKAGEAADDPYGELIVYGVFAMFFFQVFENVGMNMGIMPVTGVTLPFVSYGASSLLANMTALALVLNVTIRSKMITF